MRRNEFQALAGSRELHPKPFIRLADRQSLLRGAVLPDVVEMLDVTNRELFFKTEDQTF